MKKSTKYISSAGIITGLAYLLFHADLAKAKVRKFKSSLMTSRQLFNRLIEQLKNTKQNSAALKAALQKMNLKPIKSHLDHFNRHLQPEMKKLQAISKRMKK